MDYTEDSLIEKPTIVLFAELGWEIANCYNETFGPQGTLGREIPNEVLLLSRLYPALEHLNPDLPTEAYKLAIEELSRDRSLMSPAHANHEIYMLLKDGVKVTFRNEEGVDTFETVYLIDWETPSNNDFFLASQFWVSSEYYKRRPDLLGFINGIPLVFIELKAVQAAGLVNHHRHGEGLAHIYNRLSGVYPHGGILQSGILRLN